MRKLIVLATTAAALAAPSTASAADPVVCKSGEALLTCAERTADETVEWAITRFFYCTGSCVIPDRLVPQVIVEVNRRVDEACALANCP
jgi:hypothetical protein